MAKTGRNEACPCGSGKKYKHCCLAKDAEAGRATRVAERQNTGVLPAPHDRLHHLFCEDCYARLAAASNAVMDMITAGKLDEAEPAAHGLLETFPDAYDGYARLGLIFETRGDHRQAADCYRTVIALARQAPHLYEPGFEDGYQVLVDRLDPPPAASS